MIKKFREYFKESMFFPTPKDKIVQLCKEYNIRNYSINPDFSIDVVDDVYFINYFRIKSLPLRFYRVGRDFNCSNNLLTTLVGSPREVGEDFDCSHNQLATLEGSPGVVIGSFNCSYNLLTTLDGCPREVVGDFNCSYNPVTEILDKFPYPKKVLKFWDDFNVVRNGNEVSAYRFKEMYLDLTGKEFKGNMKFEGYKVVG